MPSCDTSTLMSKIRKDFLKISLICSLPRLYIDTLSVDEIRLLLRDCIPAVSLKRDRGKLLMYYDELRKQYDHARNNTELFKLCDEAFRAKRANMRGDEALSEILSTIFDFKDL